MTQTALDSYAMANGFGKTTSAMTEAEKVALRYSFVQDQLATASGDFARTSGGWANQVKVLQLQFESLQATLGQGFINLFTPVLQMINKIIAKLVSLASAFKAFTELITGNSSSSGDSATESLDSAAASAESLTDATNAAGDAASNTAKKMRELMGFDSINKLSDNSSSSSGSSGGASGSADSYDFGTLETGETVLDDVDNKFQGIIERFKELQNLFKKGFEAGIGDTSALQSIQDSLNSIKQSCYEIFYDSGLTDAFNGWVDSLAYALGSVSGSFASIGITIADNLLGGLEEYLGGNKTRITSYLTNMFNIGTEINEMVASASAAFAEIFSVFRSDDAKSITSDFIQVFSDGFMGITELAGKLGTDLLGLITTPITENQDKIKSALENTLKPISEMSESFSETWRYLWDNVQKLYDEHAKPLFDNLTEGISKIVGILVDGYNTYIAPVLDLLARKFKEVQEEHIRPMLDNMMEAAGNVLDLLNTIWKNVLEPLFSWIAEVIMPILQPIVALLGGALLLAIEEVSYKFSQYSTIIGALAKDLKEFIEKASKAVSALKEFPSKVTTTITAIKDKAWDKVKAAYDKLKNSKAVKTISGLKAKAWTSVKSAYDKLKSGKATKTISALRAKAWTTVKSAWDKVKSSKVTKTISGLKAKAWSNITSAWNKLKNTTIYKTLSAKKSAAFDKFKQMWDSLKDKTLSIKADVTAAITNIKNLINDKIIAKLNGAITTLNKLPGINVPSIPYLAQGGYVKRNTPQLAVIGDNMRQGEIVAPEDKLLAMARQAAAMSGGASSAEVVSLLRQILTLLQSLDLVATVDVNALKQLIVRLINDNTKATGMCEINI